MEIVFLAPEFGNFFEPLTALVSLEPCGLTCWWLLVWWRISNDYWNYVLFFKMFAGWNQVKLLCVFAVVIWSYLHMWLFKVILCLFCGFIIYIYVCVCVRACVRLCDVGVCVCTLEEKALKGLLLYNSTTFAVFGLK